MSVKFVIVAAPRTGSTLLVRTLNSLDDVCCHGELLQLRMVRGYDDGFNPVKASNSEREDRTKRLLLIREQDPVGFIQRALSGPCAATGLKILYKQFLLSHWGNVTHSLLAIPNIKFIHLTRHNSLRRYISEQIAGAGGPIHSQLGGKSDNPIKVHVDINDFLRRTSEVATDGQRVASELAGQDVLNISYEQLSANLVATVAQVCQFIEVKIDQSSITPALEKVGSADLRDSVSNYQDLLENDTTRALLCD